MSLVSLMEFCIPSKYVATEPIGKVWYDSVIRKFSRTGKSVLQTKRRCLLVSDWINYKNKTNFSIN